MANSLAEDIPDRFGVRTGNVLQLAAVCISMMQRPAGRPFASDDKRLLEAAEQLGFRTIAV